MIRSALLSLIVCALIGPLALADEPTKPQWQRMLTGDDAKKAEELESQIQRLESLDKRPEAVKVAEELLKFREQKQGADHYEVADARLLLAELQQNRTDEQQDQLRQARQLSDNGSDAFNSGRYTEAQALFQRSSTIREMVLGENHRATALSFNNLAVSLNSQGKFGEARPLLEKALGIREKLLGKNHPQVAQACNNLGTNLYYTGRYAEAQILFQKTLDDYRELRGEVHADTAGCYNNVGANLSAQGNYAEATLHFKAALDIFRTVHGETHTSTAVAYNNVAGSLQLLGENAEAQTLYQKALNIVRELFGEEHPDTATSYNNLATVVHGQGQRAAAQRFFTKAVDIREKVLGGFHPDTCVSLANLAANLYDQGMHAEAKQIVERAIRCYEASRVTGASGLARALLRNFNPRLMLAVLQHSQSPEDAWKSFELSLARGLLDQKASRSESALTPAESEEQVKQLKWVAAVQPKIVALVSKRTRTKAEAAELEKLLMERREAEAQLASAAAASSQHQVADSGTIREAISANAALLFWLDVVTLSGIDEEHWVCVVRPGEVPKWEPLRGTGANGKWMEDDKQLPGKLLTALTTSAPRAEVDILVEQLRAQRIAPVLHHLEGVKTLYVVPVGAMGGVPIELLVQDRSVSYIPSGTFLARAKSQARPFGKNMLAIGAPNFHRPSQQPAVAKERDTDALLASLQGGNWIALPGTRIEIERLRKLFMDRCEVLTGTKASEQKLESMRKSGELAKFRYLHFATHGEGNDAVAFESALILSQDKVSPDALPKAGEPYINGQLSAAEVLEFWKLDAELVTLSACETAVGKASSGDGSLGFAQAFLHAGARSVCLSLWKVDDTATALLMERFYANLLGVREDLKGPMGKAAALDEAKRWLRSLTREQVRAWQRQQAGGAAEIATPDCERPGLVRVPVREYPKKPRLGPYANPRYWAAFILIGDPN